MCVCGQQLGLTVEQEIRDRAGDMASRIIAGTHLVPHTEDIRENLDRIAHATIHLGDQFADWIRGGQLPTTAARLSNKELVDLVRERFAGVVTADGRTHLIDDINYLATNTPHRPQRD
jgi:hypothetical protein